MESLHGRRRGWFGYYFLSATALNVIAETVRAGDAASLTTALGAIGGSLQVSQDKSLQVVLDEVVEKLDVLSQAEQKLDQEADRQWFADTIREELARLGSTVRYKVKLGDRAVMGVSNSQATVDPNAPESVHIAAWPVYNEALIDEELNRDMEVVIRMANFGQVARDKTVVKMTQPLVEAIFTVNNAEERRVIETYADLLTESLNVKHVSVVEATDKDTDTFIKAQPGLMIVSEGSGESVMMIMFTPAD